MSDKLKVDTRVTVETPEGVDFQFLIAGPGKRGTSFILDTVLKIGFFVLVLLAVGVLSAGLREVNGVGAGMVLITWFAMSWLYGSCCEAFLNGQTLGKKSQNLRVVRTNGTPIGWFEAFGRNLLLVADSFLVLAVIPLCTVGLISMAATRKMQRLGDLVFDTMVIDEKREFISRAPGITEGVERIPRAECSGRFYVPERTLAVIERIFEGDRLISDGRREEIARTLSQTIRQWLGYVEPGPDPKNPNTYFTQVPQKHTVFLQRVLKTFAESEDDAIESESLNHAAIGRLRPGRRAVGGGQRQEESVQTLAAAVVEPPEDLTADFAEQLSEYSQEEGFPDDDDRGGLPPDWRTTS